MAVGFARPAPVLVVIGAATAGSALGFLPWNAPKARLFLGDVGSYFFGALVTLGIIAGAHRTPMELILIAPLAIYLADTGYTLLKRAVRRQPLLAAHREHVYQRLVNEAGLPHLSVALGTALLALIITAAWVPGSIPLGLVTTLVVVAAYLSLPSLLNRRGLSVTRQPSGVT